MKKKVKKYIVHTKSSIEDTYKLFKLSKARIKYIEKLVDKIISERK